MEVHDMWPFPCTAIKNIPANHDHPKSREAGKMNGSAKPCPSGADNVLRMILRWPEKIRKKFEGEFHVRGSTG